MRRLLKMNFKGASGIGFLAVVPFGFYALISLTYATSKYKLGKFIYRAQKDGSLFGFKECPAVCPLTMSYLGQAYGQLEQSQR